MWIAAFVALATGQEPAIDVLLAGLGHEAVEQREAAESGLKSLGRDVLPALRRAAATASDLETRARLDRVIRHFTRVRWFSDLGEARRQAAAQRKPLLIFSTMGPLNGYVCLGGHLMRSLTFADPKVVDAVNDGFVAVWHNHNPERSLEGAQATYSREEAAAYPEGGGGNNLHTVIATPAGTVLQSLTGYWSPEVFLRELEFARGLTPSNRAARREARGNALQEESARLLAEHPEEAGRRVRESPLLRRRAALLLLATNYEEDNGAVTNVEMLLQLYSMESRQRVFA